MVLPSLQQVMTVILQSLQQVMAPILACLQQVMVAIVTMIDPFIAKIITKCAGTPMSLHLTLGFINLVISCATAFIIARANFKDIKNIEIAYAMFILGSVLSLGHVSCTGALMSNATSTFSSWMENRLFRWSVSQYYYWDTITLTTSIGRLSVMEVNDNRKHHVKVLNLACYSILIVIYITGLYVGRNLRSGYEGTLLAFILSSSYTFATTFADQTANPLIVIVVAAAIGSVLVTMTEFWLSNSEEVPVPLLQEVKKTLSLKTGRIITDVLVPGLRGQEGQAAENLILEEAQAQLINEARETLVKHVDDALTKAGPAAAREALREAIRRRKRIAGVDGPEVQITNQPRN